MKGWQVSVLCVPVRRWLTADVFEYVLSATLWVFAILMLIAALS